MEIIFFLLPVSLALGGLGCIAYLWCVKSGQFDDLDTPSVKLLIDEAEQAKQDGAEVNE